MHHTAQKRTLVLVAVVAACVALPFGAAQAQRPTVDAALMTRARTACDAAAAKAGYNILRRDAETHATTTIAFPLHVRHGTAEANVTCTYDTHRGSANLSELRAEEHAAARADQRAETREARAERLCRDYVNGRAGYRVESTGNPTAHGAMLDVPVRVRHNGRSNVLVTCRDNTANSKLSLRQ